MIFKFPVLRIAMLVLFSFFAFKTIAQPILPAIAGTSERGVVILTWNCQYNGIKSIAVQRSADSIHNFHTVGYVKGLDKGIQAFVDGHPSPGKNFYQLYIVFSSDLTWNSNTLKLTIDSSELINDELVLPPNDSLQKFLITNNLKKNRSHSGIVINIDTSANGDGKPLTAEEMVANAVLDGASGTMKTSAGAGPGTSRQKISISFVEDPNEVNPYTFIKARFIYTDPLTGHINMVLPDDVKAHHYSVKFYDLAKNQVLEVPKIDAPKIIIDKRNFERKGVYKFILVKDLRELETGYISIY